MEGLDKVYFKQGAANVIMTALVKGSFTVDLGDNLPCFLPNSLLKLPHLSRLLFFRKPTFFKIVKLDMINRKI